MEISEKNIWKLSKIKHCNSLTTADEKIIDTDNY